MSDTVTVTIAITSPRHTTPRHATTHHPMVVVRIWYGHQTHDPCCVIACPPCVCHPLSKPATDRPKMNITFLIITISITVTYAFIHMLCMHMYIQLCVYVCTHTPISLALYIYIYIYIYIYTSYIYIYIYIYIHIYIYIYIYVLHIMYTWRASHERREDRLDEPRLGRDLPGDLSGGFEQFPD